MVEDQQGIKNVLSFGAKSVDPGILEQLLVGRERSAEYLFHAAEGIVEHGNNQQILVIGQRGMGKTHLLRLLYHQCQEYIKTERLVVAYFSEEEYGVSDYFDFLVRVLYAFIRWNLDDLPFLDKKLGELQSTPPSGQVYLLEEIIREYVADRPLLILAENFADLLNSMGPQEQGKFRAWIYENKRVSIIATSQALSDDFDKEDRPFYGFFQLYYLKSISYKDSMNFLVALADLDNRPDIVEYIKTKGRAQVRAIYDLVKGNHRLLVTFYEFLKSDTLAKLSNHFIKTINDLKPYYETYIRYLPPQQQKVLRYIALSRKPQHGNAISRNCFIDPKSLSKQLSELARKKLIEVIPDRVDKRNKLYDINEPLLRISIEVGEHKEGITALFVDFLALFYDEEELESRKMKFADLLAGSINMIEKKTIQYEIQAIERALDIKKEPVRDIVKEVVRLCRAGKEKEALKFLESKQTFLSAADFLHLASIIYYFLDEFKKMLECLSQLDLGEISSRKLFFYWGYALLTQAAGSDGKKEEVLRESIDKFEKSESNREGDSRNYLFWGKALIELTMITGSESDLLSALKKLQLAIDQDSNDPDGYSEMALAHLGGFLAFQKTEYAISVYNYVKRALAIDPENDMALSVWIVGVAMANRIAESDIMHMEEFRLFFTNRPFEIRVEIWRRVLGSGNLKLYMYLLHMLVSEVREHSELMRPILIEWINSTLAPSKSNLTKDELEMLREMLLEIKDVIPEVAVSLSYIDVYEDYFINKNENALFELPKEQRVFFEKNILNE